MHACLCVFTAFNFYMVTSLLHRGHSRSFFAQTRQSTCEQGANVHIRGGKHTEKHTGHSAMTHTARRRRGGRNSSAGHEEIFRAGACSYPSAPELGKNLASRGVWRNLIRSSASAVRCDGAVPEAPVPEVPVAQPLSSSAREGAAGGAGPRAEWRVGGRGAGRGGEGAGG